MEINKALEKALELSDLNFNRIQYIIDEEYYGSSRSYIEYIMSLSSEFEAGFAMFIINTPTEKASTFIQLSLNRIRNAIKAINVLETIYSKTQEAIDQDVDCKEIVDGLLRPVSQAHLSQLTYIEKIMNNAFHGINGKYFSAEVTNGAKDNIDSIAENKITQIENLLSKYGDTLTIKDMQEIEHVKRDTIYRRMSEGWYKKCSADNKTVLFNKNEIKRYLLSKEI